MLNELIFQDLVERLRSVGCSPWADLGVRIHVCQRGFSRVCLSFHHPQQSTGSFHLYLPLFHGQKGGYYISVSLMGMRFG